MISVSKIVAAKGTVFSECLGESKELVVNLCRMLHVQKKDWETHTYKSKALEWKMMFTMVSH